jgi:hypothetical protein
MLVIDGYSELRVLLVLFVLSDAWLGEWSYFFMGWISEVFRAVTDVLWGLKSTLSMKLT